MTSQHRPVPGTERYWSELSSPGTCVVHVEEDHDVFIGKANGNDLASSEPGADGWLGNPFSVVENGREEAVARYAGLLLSRVEEDDEVRGQLWNLKGARLACYCRRSDEDSPLCHGDVLVRVINGIERRSTS